MNPVPTLLILQILAILLSVYLIGIVLFLVTIRALRHLNREPPRTGSRQKPQRSLCGTQLICSQCGLHAYFDYNPSTGRFHLEESQTSAANSRHTNAPLPDERSEVPIEHSGTQSAGP